MSTTPAVRHHTVGPESAGQRLDNFLLRELKGVPKTHLYRIIRSGEVRVNKGRAQADTRLSVHDVVRVPPLRLPEKTAAAVVPAREFPVLFEDAGLIVIDKPAGVAVHGGSGVSFGVIEQLRQARTDTPWLELVHRLDRETSGVLLIAKKRGVLKGLQDQFRERQTQKTYLALVKGAWPVNKKVIDQPLQKYLLPDGERRVRVTGADDPDGMRSITLVKVLQNVKLHGSWLGNEAAPVCSLLAVTIKTGRTHQIRVHLAAAGHPILGDDKYGDFDLNRLLQKQGHRRMFLHAWQLGVVHPLDGTPQKFCADLPDELKNWANFSGLFV